MGFFVGLLFGLFAGLAIVVLFVRSENSRSNLRTKLATTVAAFARMTVEDSRKILPAEFYPSWVVFSQRQKLTWLNQHLTKIWPYVDEAASDLIKASVEPVLEQYRPVILSSLKFSKFTLGAVAPQFTGVSILEDGADSVIMELEMQWDANSNIVLAIKTYLGVSLPVQKKLDFTLKVIGGDISTIPGLADAIESTIRDAIEDSIMWPVRKIIPILPGDYSDLELKPVGMLEVKLIQARDLTNKDIIGKSDPYADATTQHLVVRIYDDEGVQASEFIGCAQVLLSELEPGKVKDVWLNLVKDLEIQRDSKYRGQNLFKAILFYLSNCNACSFPSPDGLGALGALVLSVWHGEQFYKPLSSDFSMTSLERVLKNGANGTDDIENEKAVTHKKREIIIRGVLSVTVISAEDLPIVDLMGKADPYVVLTMKKSELKNKTRVVNDSLNPVWNQTFDFVVEDGLHDMLILEVWDHDTFGKDYMGRCILTLTRVILEGEYKDCMPLEGAKSGKLNINLKWMPQPIFRDS
ncbi:hypothetical protein GOBAR_AA06547 [Gossypium barbadense]|uniref:C2 domain-containing protein n=1 Tax=Gossypium barbadense TaxID=3634 RepID=A0A2P5YES4_GOSBA|nr:hypothetical protein GOBAR_AA06547 [Gossypium barbadense]